MRASPIPVAMVSGELAAKFGEAFGWVPRSGVLRGACRRRPTHFGKEGDADTPAASRTYPSSVFRKPAIGEAGESWRAPPWRGIGVDVTEGIPY